VGLAGLAVITAGESVSYDDFGPTEALLDGLVAVAFLAAGLVAWRQRPGNAIGPLMIALGFVWVSGNLRYTDVGLVTSFGRMFGSLWQGFLVHLLLAYPTGRLLTRVDRAIVVATYALALLGEWAFLIFFDPQVSACADCPMGPNWLLLFPNDGAYDALTLVVELVRGAGIIAVVASLAVRWRHATPPARRVLAPMLVTGAAALAGLYAGEFEIFAAQPWEDIFDTLRVVGLTTVPFAFLFGLLRTRMTRSIVGQLVVELSGAPGPERVREALRRALGDPSLELGFWASESGQYVDAAGHPLSLPDDDPDRAVARLDDPGGPLAVLIHDRAVLDDPGLIEAAGAAARLALQNARLQAEVRAQLEEVRASRARIVQASDAERRRVERNLHDGAQQRLVSLALSLRMVREQLGAAGDPALDELLRLAEGESKQAIDELRELARGIHPKILTEDGLGAALESLAERATVPVERHLELRARLDPAVEAAAYFVCSEALANVAKYARASGAVITAVQRGGELHIDVRDDGVGGAQVKQGSGLGGLADRVEAVGGNLRVASEPGQGTRVTARLPAKPALTTTQG
jgi:signal transduction histidine kinase